MMKKIAILALLYFCLVAPASAISDRAFWPDVRYWVNINNVLGADPLRSEDLIILQEIRSDGGLYSTHRSRTGDEIPQAVAAWAYLAELGVAIIRSGDAVDAETYLTATAETSRFYKTRMFETVPGKYGQGRMMNTPWYDNLRDSTYVVDTPLPYNWSASFAYFNAVRNNIHKQFRGTESYYNVSAAFQVYQYLHTQITIYRYDPQGTNRQFVQWKNSENDVDVGPDSADDVSHGGLSARCLAYGANDNYVWRRWANILFNEMKPIILSTKPERINMTGSDPAATGHHYWNLPY